MTWLSRVLALCLLAVGLTACGNDAASTPPGADWSPAARTVAGLRTLVQSDA